MHFHFDFSAPEILWTLTFAALLVLLVVLLGRDRVRRFPWFTATIAMTALRLVAGKLLVGRMPPLTSSEIFLAMADIAEIIILGVVVEMARRAFAGARRKTWMIATLILLAVGGVILVKWGPWPSMKTLLGASTLSVLRLMQLFAQKAELLADLLFIQLGLLVVLFGRRFGAGWRSHTQRIVIGLSTASLAQVAVRIIWQVIALNTTIHEQDQYQRVMKLQGRFLDANSAIYLVVLVWWIVCLWFDEPGGTAPSEVSEQPTPQTAETTAMNVENDAVNGAEPDS